MSDAKKSFQESNYFFAEQQIPKEWHPQWVQDPMFGDEDFFLIEHFHCEENCVNRSHDLRLDFETGRRTNVPRFTELRREAGARKAAVTRGAQKRARVKEHKVRKKMYLAFRHEERAKANRKKRSEYSRKVVFHLGQCAFTRKRINLLRQFGDCTLSAERILKEHQNELLKLRALKQAT